MKDIKKFRGGPEDPRCRAGYRQMIDKKVCRNNCKYWVFEGGRGGYCGLGY